jgi:hypothetical protein
MDKALKLFYEEIVIGTGPSAMGYLTGIKTELSKSERSVLLITRDTVNDKGLRQHPKLCKNSHCIVDTKKTLGLNVPGATSAHGGLSNAWGGVLVELSVSAIKKSYKCNNTDAEQIKNFYLEIVREIKKDIEVDELSFNTETEKIFVIKGSKEYGWENEGLSIASTIDRLAGELGIKIQSGLIINSVFKINKDFKWMLKGVINNEVVTLYCNHLVLAAGVISNISLFHNKESFPHIMDHLPYQIAGLSFSSVIKNNTKTPIVKINKADQYIDVEYRINKLSKAFLTNFYGARKGLFVYHLSHILPISMWQIWTESTNIVISKKNTKGGVCKFSWGNIIKSCLRVVKSKALPLYIIKTKEGEGFHYISPDFISKGKGSSLDKDKSIVILGGAAMRDLPMHHPSLTFMAHAAWVGAKYAKN